MYLYKFSNKELWLLILFIILIFLIVFSIRYAWWRKNVSYEYPRVLMYHMVSEQLKDSKFNRLRVSPDKFENQIKWLKKNRFTSYTVGELMKIKKMPYKAVCITFDDGYEDNYTNAFRIMKKYGFKGTIFIMHNRHSKDSQKDKETLLPIEELSNEPMLNDKEIKEMIESGLIEIGSHTINHINLKKLSQEDRENEIINSKKAIENQYGIVCNSFAYPYGYYYKSDIEIVKKAGYLNASSTINQILDPNNFNKFEIPRLYINGNYNMLQFILKIKKGRVR